MQQLERARAHQALLALVGAVCTACAGEGVGPSGDIVIALDGRVERSAEITLTASLDGIRLADSSVTWSADPPGTVAFHGDGRATLLAAGRITVRAAAQGATGSLGLDVAVPPTIVFDLLVHGNRDIYRAALDGEDVVRLTDHPADDRDPAVAGGTVVFVSYRDNNGELYAVPLDGGTPQRLTTTQVTEAGPAPSPDATRLAYTRSDAGIPKLWLANADGSGPVRVSTNFGFAGSIEASPAWAPTGDRLAFVSTTEGSADLFTYDVRSAAFAQLVPDSASSAEVEPAWNPDGQWVAFASNRPGDTELFLVEVATGALTRLTTRAGTDAQPAWVGADRLVYVAWVDGTPRLRWLDLAREPTVHEIDLGFGTPRRPAGASITR